MKPLHCTRCMMFTLHRDNACIVCRTVAEVPTEKELEDAGQALLFDIPTTEEAA